MRHVLIALSILLGAASPAMAQFSVTVAIPGASIGISQPMYPELVLVPGYPVYYAPHARANYFFYDGLYWVYQDDHWYASSWYDGPWDLVEPDDVPLFVLRVPVRYYVRPPAYFSGWVVTSAPPWHVHWGPRWTHYRPGWDHWDRRVAYVPAPLPVYQRHYAGDHYPRREYQRVISREHYHYQPRDQTVRQHDRQWTATPPHREREGSWRDESRRTEPERVQPWQRIPVVQEQRQPPRQESERRAQPQSHGRPDVPRTQSAAREREDARRPEAMQLLPQQRAAMMQERQQQRQQHQQQPQPRQLQPPSQPQPQQTPHAQQAPRPQQTRDRGPQDRGDRRHHGNPERRQGPERSGDRGPGRG